MTVERVPWATGKNSLTKAYTYFLAGWAKRMSWAEVAKAFRTSWESVFRSVERVVEWGLSRRCLDGVKSIGVDEVLWRSGYQFLTVVYPIDEGCRRLLWVDRDRKAKTMLRFFRQFGRKRSVALRFVCSDLWQPYLLRAVRSCLLREEFQLFWNDVSPFWAGIFLDRWCTKVMRSRIEPMKKIVRSLRSHKALILNWFRARYLLSFGLS